eukprot:CAMPEP_0113529262 /NCGR_PEP_ID=MMETSP0015_2-20120614/2298_1 /TAXON_ID=2838 /ORGANISM="Odontella" /LENGTH=384 /DNA_ID=CAMNT_0000427877 /DNA_START=73 /DNA_END=1227 /DNA_ORIENTATION=- /assembly_acc=CAM_ASM_000160
MMPSSRRRRGTLLALALTTPPLASSLSIPQTAIETINAGGIAVVPDFFSPSFVSRLRSDAVNLHAEGQFITDGLAGYGSSANTRDKRNFDPSRDRSVLPAYIPSKRTPGPFVSSTLGDADVRKQMTSNVASLRSELSIRLDRPGFDTPDGPENHEISYTRFGPGANLARHVDEHHEELKGARGWSAPTRRSISWLVYLNPPDWDANGGKDGGALRTYERRSRSAYPVGARNGDLQIGWLAPSRDDGRERPVFLDGRRDGRSGRCSLYVDSDDGGRRAYVTEDFDADPYLFLTGDFFVRNLLIKNRHLGRRFHYLEQPKSALTKYFRDDPGEAARDVAPTGGTLVMFDSVTLPHEVLATTERERWAASGWFHEKHQPIPTKQIIL